MKKLLLALLSVFCPLYASESSKVDDLASYYGDPSVFIWDSVNALTGEFFVKQNDVTVIGAQNLYVNRTYLSKPAENKTLWEPIDHFKIVKKQKLPIWVKPEKDFPYKKDQHLVIKEPSGAEFYFGKVKHSDTFTPFPEQFDAGYIFRLLNDGGYPYNIEKCSCVRHNNIITLSHSNGCKRVYKKSALTPDTFYLKEEILPTGHTILYKGGDTAGFTETLITPTGKELASLKYTYPFHTKGSQYDISVETSNNHLLTYHYEKKNGTFRLQRAKTPNFPEEKIRRSEKKARLKKREFPGGRIYQLSYGTGKYSKNKITKLVGPERTFCTFKYDQNSTRVIDQTGCKTTYFYHPTSKRLREIQTEDQDGKVFQRRSFDYDKGGKLRKEIICKKSTILLTKTFAYDRNGNLTSKTLKGTITADQENFETYKTSYTYDKYHRLLTEEEQNGKKTTYTYLKKNHLPTSKLTEKEGHILERITYTYNDDHILINETIDDGPDASLRLIKQVTPRQEKPFYGMPKTIAEYYETDQECVLLKKTDLEYDQWGHVTKETLTDSEGTSRYTTEKIYNEKGQLLLETDPLGQTTTYEYDVNGNQTKIITPTGLTTTFTYDMCNRLIEKKEEGSGHTYVTTYADFDSHDQPCTIISPEGTITHNTYNPLGQLIETTSPLGDTTKYRYNALGHITRIEDPRGYKTRTSRNIYGDPLNIAHPDGSKEIHTYNLDGTLASYTNQNGNTTTYTYDPYGNICREDSPSGTITRTYSAFHLLEETDQEGNTTTYTYDRAGRLISKTHIDTTTTYTYDPLGRCIREQTGDHIQEKTYDLLNRITSQKEYSYDKLLTCKETTYEPLRTTHTNYPNNEPAISCTLCDAFDREVSFQDAEGLQTTTTYVPSRQPSQGPKG